VRPPRGALWVALTLIVCLLPCRDELKRHYNLGQYWVEVEMEDLASFDEDLADYLYKQPTEHLQLVRDGMGHVMCRRCGVRVVLTAVLFIAGRSSEGGGG